MAEVLKTNTVENNEVNLQSEVDKLTKASLFYKEKKEIGELVASFKIKMLEDVVREITPDKAEEILKAYHMKLSKVDNSLVK